MINKTLQNNKNNEIIYIMLYFNGITLYKKTNIKLKNNTKKVLIIRLSSMGDVVLTTPLVRCIRNKYHNSIIEFVVDKRFSDVIKYNPHINDIIEYDRNDANYNKKIKEKLDTDYTIIDLQNNRRSKLFRSGLGKVIGVFDKYRLKKLSLVYLKKNYFNNITIPERYINTASVLDIRNDNKGLEVWLPEENNAKIYKPENKIYSNVPNKITIVPSATHYTKRWLPDYFIELINMIYDKYASNFNLIGSNNDKEICKYIASKLRNKINIVDYSGKTSILEATHIIDKSDLMITNDTGLMHIAAARQVPIVALYGSTVRDLGFAPYKAKNTICEVELKCRPCSHIGRKQCSKKHFNCMTLLSPDIVFNKMESLISNLYKTKKHK